jgi:hypothetical protein
MVLLRMIRDGRLTAARGRPIRGQGATKAAGAAAVAGGESMAGKRSQIR